MRSLIPIIILVILSGCAYTYEMGVKQGTPSSEITTIYFSNHIKIAEIDGDAFEPKFSIWKDGSHTIHLPPGRHSFTFRYQDVGGNGGFYTRDFKTLSKSMKSGKKYEIASKIHGSRIFFELKEMLKEDTGSIADRCDIAPDPLECSSQYSVDL